MENLLPWMTAHWGEIAAIWAALHVMAVTIVNLTPTPKDDAVIGKVYGLVEKFAGIWTAKAKQ